MTTHWESSQKPLFVKSVWLNGYRHAILYKRAPVKSRTVSAVSSRKDCVKHKPIWELPSLELMLPDIEKRCTKGKLSFDIGYDGHEKGDVLERYVGLLTDRVLVWLDLSAKIIYFPLPKCDGGERNKNYIPLKEDLKADESNIIVSTKKIIPKICINNVKETSLNATIVPKRQVHIFIPNVNKKIV